MRIFLVANIVVSALIRTDANYKVAIRVLSLSKLRFQIHVSAVSLAIGFYFASKKYNQAVAKQNLASLIQRVQIANCGAEETSIAIKNKQAIDFEDGLQYYAALNADCTCIITENVKDFYYSNIEVMNSRMFLEKYLLFN